MAHITESQRYTISRMLGEGYKQKAIAEAIGKDKSVVSREIKRNRDERTSKYDDDLANRKYLNRQKKKRKHVKFISEMEDRVEVLLKKDYSPEQIVGYMKKKGEDVVSMERIYQHVWSDKKKGGTLHEHLRRQGRRNAKRGNKQAGRGMIKNRIGIEKRPAEVEERKRFGDLEVDLIIGKNHHQAIVTINDRASGMLKMRKVNSKESKEVSRAIISELEDWKPYIETMTSDNGKEFAGHELVSSELLIDFYFARPYHSWERGSNENLNGLVRQYFKKGADFTIVTQEDIKKVENILNNRPRKRFGFETPTFIMEKLLFSNSVAFIT